ncbi:MAG: hypothetical protein KBT36_14735 [Kurthia sp.]|nr:hypothetical protein [Candidatus Kurthia equi]
MGKKKYYDENGKQIRSRLSKPFYKKWSLWMIVFFSALLGAIGIYTISDEGKSRDATIEKKEPKKEITTNKKDSQHTDLEIEEKVPTYTYENFKGTYIQFEGEPYKSSIQGMSPVIVIGDASYYKFNRWDFEMTSTITDIAISESTLTLDLDSPADKIWGIPSKRESKQFELRYDGDKKILYSITDDTTLYSISKEDLQAHYTQSEIDYARIIMTLRGVPSLDSWAAYSSEYSGDKPLIGVSYNKKGESIPNITDYGHVKYPENVTTLYLKNKARHAEISYTYSSIGDGYIKVYPVPLNYALKTGEEVLNTVEEYYIQPFEPYEVADFIGHIEFDKY